MRTGIFFSEHYEFLEDIANIGMISIVILPLALPAVFKVCLLVAGALLFAWMDHPVKGDKPLCGQDINSVGIKRPWQEIEPESNIHART